MPKQTLKLRECGDLQCGTVDESTPVIPRVKILGWESRNRRQYLPESVSESDYEDISVNLNHPDGANKTRLVQERFGWFQGVTKEADGFYGNLHYNPELPYARAFAWWAKNKPSKIGMSHDAVGSGTTKNGVFIVEKVQPKSVDLVADPASTKGLHESMEPDLNPSPDTGADEVKTLADHVADAINALVKDESLDAKVKMKKIKAALKLLEEPGSEGDEEEEVEEDDEEEDKKTEESVKAVLALDKKSWGKGLKRVRENIKANAKKRPSKSKSLREELDAVKVKLAATERKALAEKLIADAKIPAAFITTQFLSQLSEARDEKALKALVEERKQLASIERPRSSGPINLTDPAKVDTKSFAAQIKGK